MKRAGEPARTASLFQRPVYSWTEPITGLSLCVNSSPVLHRLSHPALTVHLLASVIALILAVQATQRHTRKHGDESGRGQVLSTNSRGQSVATELSLERLLIQISKPEITKLAKSLTLDPALSRENSEKGLQSLDVERAYKKSGQCLETSEWSGLAPFMSTSKGYCDMKMIRPTFHEFPSTCIINIYSQSVPGHKFQIDTFGVKIPANKIFQFGNSRLGFYGPHVGQEAGNETSQPWSNTGKDNATLRMRMGSGLIWRVKCDPSHRTGKDKTALRMRMGTSFRRGVVNQDFSSPVFRLDKTKIATLN
ncbi:hypothetical protein RRG08_055731 [Elysia crispata]|uniref:Uncharacterized protein n=1 Tax=Elysia crispata TaxID=231223 RepID=A0AAE1AZR9_9GAST|nr:hypothetical protein RRG08_055731 [Elysia crispata]